ncbi:MAG: hypothetical protein V7708_16350 [Oceanicoccus sp.]
MKLAMLGRKTIGYEFYRTYPSPLQSLSGWSSDTWRLFWQEGTSFTIEDPQLYCIFIQWFSAVDIFKKYAATSMVKVSNKLIPLNSHKPTEISLMRTIRAALDPDNWQVLADGRIFSV